MKEGLLAAGTALLVFALELVTYWRVQKITQSNRAKGGRDFVVWGGLISLSGLVVAIVAATHLLTAAIRLPTVSFGIAIMLAGSIMWIQGRDLQQKPLTGLRLGSFLALGAALACIGIALSKFVSG